MGVLPLRCMSDSSASSGSGEPHTGSLTAAGRIPAGLASESGGGTDHGGWAAEESDRDSQQGAISLEGCADRHGDTPSPSMCSETQGASSAAHSLHDAEERANYIEGQGICQSSCSELSQQGRRPSRDLASSASTVSQASAAEADHERRESNPLYACSLSSASTGLRGAQRNPAYACSTSSASTGTALPQRSLYWPQPQHSALSATSIAAPAPLSIPEDAASEVQFCPSRLHACAVKGWENAGSSRIIVGPYKLLAT